MDETRDRGGVDSSQSPTFASHYYVAGRPPFLNLSDLSEEDLASVLSQLNDERATGRSHRSFGKRYMELRRRTEAKLRGLFLARGGVIERPNPHYFVLGECRWFAALSSDMRAVHIDLVDLPRESTSITYPDSFVAMRCGIDFGLPDLDRPYLEQAFFLDELHELVESFGLPDDRPDENYAGYELRDFEKFIEIQVWSDDPVLEFIATN